MRLRLALLCCGIVLGAPLSRAMAQGASCPPARTALVLSGGGAKGFTHLGVLETLDSLGIVPDLIVGSSAGAVIGALYAAGESPMSIRRRFGAARLDAVVHEYDPALSPSLVGLPAAAVWERSPSRWVLQSGAVREGEVNAILSALSLHANLMAAGSFDRLPIPFRAGTGAYVGDLLGGVRAGMELETPFGPIRVEEGFTGRGPRQALIRVGHWF